jgi:CubicO group peptidase (beta-lactamase class C family)
MLLDDLAGSVRKVQEISRTELCSLHIGIRKERYFSTFRLPDGGSAERIATSDDGRVFAGSSLFKVFMAVGASLMIEKLSAGSDPANRFRGLRNAWPRRFTDVFNEFSQGFQIKPLYGNPTVFELIVHYKGPCDINHLFLAPDGSPILSKNAFLNTISHYTEETRKQHNDNTAWCEYSNANYILIALLIEIVSEKSLPEFLREYIFDPLSMHRTYMSAEELNLLPIEQRVQPHMVSGNGIRRAIHFNEIPYLSDTVEIAAMGGYTCAADIGKFFEMVLDGLYGTPSSAMFDKDFVRSLFKGVGALDKDVHGYTRFGLSTTLDENLPGSHSLNRLISSGSDSSTYTLGKDSQNREVEAYYMAGSATGWLSTVYFLPKQQVFIIALTNTSGPLDMSDIISKLCLQEILDLRPSKIGDPNFTCRPKGWKTMAPSEIYRTHYVELAARINEENAHRYKELEEEDNASNTPTADCLNALGVYMNSKFGPYLEVIDLNGTLGVLLKGESKESKPMRFVRKGQVFRICSRSCGAAYLAIDCFGDWRNLEFGFEEENGVFVCFFREGCNLIDRFTRIEAAS